LQYETPKKPIQEVNKMIENKNSKMKLPEWLWKFAEMKCAVFWGVVGYDLQYFWNLPFSDYVFNSVIFVVGLALYLIPYDAFTNMKNPARSYLWYCILFSGACIAWAVLFDFNLMLRTCGTC
jgi:hypothetical protein